MSISLEERGSALEDAFFDKENQSKIKAMRDKLATERTRDDLRRTSGMTDDDVLDKLLALGLTGSTVAAISLVPLVWVAWADGSIQDNERQAILQGAHAKGLDEGSDGHTILSGWLAKPPQPALYEAWQEYIKALSSELNEAQNRMLKNQVVGFAQMVAESAGGFLGMRKVSEAEVTVLGKIGSAFDR